MNANAVPHAHVKGRLRLVPVAVLLTAAAMLLGGMGADALAAPPVGKDGKIHACYRVKGKPKGALRVVASARKRCKRGERKVVWSVVGSPGQSGSTGQPGQSGSGSSGANGAAGSNEAALAAKVASLALQVEGLEGLLKGVNDGDLSGAVSTVKGLTNGDLTSAVDTVKGITNGELSGAVDTLDGITNGELSGVIDTVKDLTNTELLEAVGSLPAIDAVCEQNKELTKQLNLVQGVVGGLGLSPALEALGMLKIPTLPAPLAPFACPTS